MHFLVDFPINFAVRFHSQTQLGRAKWKEKYLPILMDIASWKATTFRWLASSFECSSCTMKGKLLKWKIVSYDKQCTLGKLSSTRKAFRFSSSVLLARDRTWLKKALEHSERAHDRKNYTSSISPKSCSDFPSFFFAIRSFNGSINHVQSGGLSTETTLLVNCFDLAKSACENQLTLLHEFVMTLEARREASIKVLNAHRGLVDKYDLSTAINFFGSRFSASLVVWSSGKS